MHLQGLTCAPQEIANLKGDEARIAFVNIFKEIQGLKTKLGQYADLTEEQLSQIEDCFPEEELRAFKTTYLETAQNFRKQATQNPDTHLHKYNQKIYQFYPNMNYQIQSLSSYKLMNPLIEI